MPIRLAVFEDCETVVSMVNKVYYSSEKDFWSEGYYRISNEDFNKYLHNNWLYVLEENKCIIACILFKQEQKEIASFSMLVCHPDHRKKGIGRKMVSFVTNQAIKKANKKMYIEILSPKYWIHEEKKFLKTWYVKLGYSLKKEIDFKDYHPDHVPYMKCDLVFSLYEKSLI